MKVNDNDQERTHWYKRHISSWDHSKFYIDSIKKYTSTSDRFWLTNTMVKHNLEDNNSDANSGELCLWLLLFRFCPAISCICMIVSCWCAAGRYNLETMTPNGNSRIEIVLYKAELLHLCITISWALVARPLANLDIVVQDQHLIAGIWFWWFVELMILVSTHALLALILHYKSLAQIQ